ncbi:MAG: hypothetical protein ACP5PQ_07475, partial [Thermoproteota archaeon]
MILGGKQPTQLTVNVILRNSTGNSTAILAVSPSASPSSSASVPGAIPRIIAKHESGQAVPVNQLTTVENGTLVYLMVKGDYAKVNCSWNGGIALFDDSYGGGM